MAFSSSVVRAYRTGPYRKLVGTYAMTAGDTGGTVSTGLAGINEYNVKQTDVTDSRDPNLRITLSGSTLTITSPGQCQAAHSGIWWAVGK